VDSSRPDEAINGVPGWAHEEGHRADQGGERGGGGGAGGERGREAGEAPEDRDDGGNLSKRSLWLLRCAVGQPEGGAKGPKALFSHCLEGLILFSPHCLDGLLLFLLIVWKALFSFSSLFGRPYYLFLLIVWPLQVAHLDAVKMHAVSALPCKSGSSSEAFLLVVGWAATWQVQVRRKETEEQEEMRLQSHAHIQAEMDRGG